MTSPFGALSSELPWRAYSMEESLQNGRSTHMFEQIGGVRAVQFNDAGSAGYYFAP